MRNFTIGLVCGLVALAGFAGSASASATIDLLWSDNSDTNLFTGGIGETDVLRVILTAGPNGSIGGGVTVDYSSWNAYLDVIAFSSTMFTLPLPFNLGMTTNDPIGGLVQNINAAGGLAPGQTLLSGASFVLGQITFQRTDPGTGGEILTTLTATDHILNSAGTVIDGTTSFNVANPVPEPGTISLLGMGLGGLYLVGRRSSRKS